jgi:ferredoxin-thioredoxin reductase catalytic subunit
MSQIKIFRGPEALLGTLQEQVNKWAQKERVNIISVSSAVEKSPMGLCSVNFVTLTVTYDFVRHMSPTTNYSPQTTQNSTNAGARKSKRCPFCAEDILREAKKCRYCGEWLKDDDEHFTEVDDTPKSSYERTKEAEAAIIQDHGLQSLPIAGQENVIHYLRQKNYSKSFEELSRRMPAMTQPEAYDKLASMGRSLGQDVHAVDIESHSPKQITSASKSTVPPGQIVQVVGFILAIFLIPLSYIGWIVYQMMFG